VLLQRLPARQALQRLLHDSAPGLMRPVARPLRPQTAKPRVGRGTDTARPAAQSWSLGYA